MKDYGRMKITRPQQAAMIKAERQGPVVIINKTIAAMLVCRGYMKYARRHIVNGAGYAVKLTDKGKLWCRTGGSEDV